MVNFTTSSTHYRIASLLYSAVSDDAGHTAAATIRRNYEDLMELTNEAATAGAQIMVYPESMTGTLEWPNFNQTKAAEYAEVYPPVKTNVCSDEYGEDTSFYQHYTTACLAKNTSMYLIMNIPEIMDCSTITASEEEEEVEAIDAVSTVVTTNADRSNAGGGLQTSSPPEVTCDDLDEKRLYLFNSLAIYDPTGTLIAKYRKTSTFPLYYDTAYPQNNKERVDFTTFHTNFNVTFGVLICADATHPYIIPQYALAAGIQNILLPLYDGGRPPVTSISAIHAGHSLHNGINLIASQSQTFSGAGIYQAGTTMAWDLNMDVFSGKPFRQLFVQDLLKDPSTAATATTTTQQQQQEQQIPEEHTTLDTVNSPAEEVVLETCRWLGNEDSEVECPCIPIRVHNGTVSFAGTLTQPIIQLQQDEGENSNTTTNMQCTIKADLTSVHEATYAMMVGWRNSSQLDYILFCEIVVCHDFPDCSKDCPLCTTPYLGEATLSNLEVWASVPEYFEPGEDGGGRIMPLPILNGFAGKPMTELVEYWGGVSSRKSNDNTTQGSTSSSVHRYMATRNESRVDNLMGAGLFYIGFAPLPPPPALVASTTTTTEADEDDETTTTTMMFEGEEVDAVEVITTVEGPATSTQGGQSSEDTNTNEEGKDEAASTGNEHEEEEEEEEEGAQQQVTTSKAGEDADADAAVAQEKKRENSGASTTAFLVVFATTLLLVYWSH